MTNNIRYWLALKGIKGVGSSLMRHLLDSFKAPEAVFKAHLEELLMVKGIRRESAGEIVNFDAWAKIDSEIEKAHDLGISILNWEDESYPENLLKIYNPPPVIYVLGEIKKSDSMAMAVVGSRNASSSGIEITENFCCRLSRLGVTIVSGMARGIDTAAHRGALSAGGRTVAVTGCGLDIVYPAENRELFDKIGKNGAVVSEFPLGTTPDPGNFPRRNRIISGLSLGVLVVEASLKSGSLITAKYALEHGRDVYAIPGSINSMKSRGTNSLIKEGAKLVERPEEVLEDILPQFSPTLPLEVSIKADNRFSLNEEEEKIFSLIGAEAMHIDHIVRECMLDASDVLSILLQLELSGAIRQHPGKMFTKAYR